MNRGKQRFRVIMKLESERDRGMTVEEVEEENVDREVDVEEEDRRRKFAMTQLQHVMLEPIKLSVAKSHIFALSVCFTPLDAYSLCQPSAT